jgi:hypothetical protein
VSSGARRLELELTKVRGEAEGLAQIPLLGARLHFLVAPLASKPTFGPTVGLLHFTTGRWAGRGLAVKASARRGAVGVTVKRAGRPVSDAVVEIAGSTAKTDARGRARLKPSLAAPGTFAVLAHRARMRGRSKFVRLSR